MREELTADRKANKEVVRTYKKRMLYGLLWMAGGAAVSYLLALLFWGAIAWGAIGIVDGLIGWLNHRKQQANGSCTDVDLRYE